jgi:hypothetical protein
MRVLVSILATPNECHGYDVLRCKARYSWRLCRTLARVGIDALTHELEQKSRPAQE